MELQELSSKVDEYYTLRDQRLTKQREVDVIERKEKALQEEIIRVLNNANMKAGAGQLCVVTVQKKEKPICGDWSKLYAYIIAEDAFDLLQKRLTETAVKLRWEEGVQIPGVEPFPIFNLSISNRE